MSQCKYCFDSIIWISKPNGGWYPPFNATEDITTLEYELTWDDESNDWVASPVDKDLSLKLAPHDCKARQEMQRKQAEEPAALPVEPYKRPAVHEVVRWRNPKPEQYMRIYLRLSKHCRTCGALPGEWCTYKGDPDSYTTDLHVTRKAE